MKNLIKSKHEIRRTYNGQMLDITGAEHVEISETTRPQSSLVHVNVDGLCVLRVGRITGSTSYRRIRRSKE
jgi:hypothetical protein